ncbi:unnamed protein product [Gemmataceae bacterium]|nr:unnamed protein product [Gemmataceae bacterium]VTU02546.1 unnamed protein product [Gemmataceae bacterium]
MTLSRRLDALEQRVPRPRPSGPVPDDPVAFARGLLAGAFSPEDIDPHHANQTGWLTIVVAFLGTLTPEHRAWEAAIGFVSDPMGTDEEVLAALDAVMCRA